jgi:hypothetical protein
MFRATLFLCPVLFLIPNSLSAESIPVHLQVEAGVPLRLYATKRVPYRQNEPVEAKTAEPVWSFDRIVLPVGTRVQGHVDQLLPAPKFLRAMGMLRGDFTPVKRARVSFTQIVMPDGQVKQLAAEPAFGLASIYDPTPPKKRKKPRRPRRTIDLNSNQVGRILNQQLQAQASARSRGLLDFVRSPNKREWAEDFLLAKLPYRPQWYRKGTRFDAVLDKPIDIGQVSIDSSVLETAASQAIPDSAASVRFLSTVSSKDANVGDPIAGVLSEPLFSPTHQLLLPEGTRLNGKVTQSRPARLLKRGGQLRFTFDQVEPPPVILAARRPEPVQAQLTDVEETSGAVQVDKEGLTKATESKTRLLRPVIAGLIAAKSGDNDTGKQTASGGASAGTNYSGLALGGFSGFGLLGTTVVKAPPALGMALGYYGLAWSVYGTIISRGREVVFEKNTAMAIRFGARPGKR